MSVAVYAALISFWIHVIMSVLSKLPSKVVKLSLAADETLLVTAKALPNC